MTASPTWASSASGPIPRSRYRRRRHRAMAPRTQNGNGISDAREQDSRPVPSHLVPSLGNARSATPRSSYRDGCHTTSTSPRIHPCVLADLSGRAPLSCSSGTPMPGNGCRPRSRPARLVIGESSSITKSGCPSVDVSSQRAATSLVPGGRATPGVSAVPPPGCVPTPPSVIVLRTRVSTAHRRSGHVIAESDRGRRGGAASPDARPLAHGSQHVVLATRPSSADVPVCLARTFSGSRAASAPGNGPSAGSMTMRKAAAATANGATFRPRHAGLPIRPVPGRRQRAAHLARPEPYHRDLLRQLAPSFGPSSSRSCAPVSRCVRW